MLHRSVPWRPLRWHPLTRADLDELDALLAAIEVVDDPPRRHTRAELERAFQAMAALTAVPPSEPIMPATAGAPGPADQCRLGRDAAGVLVAYGWNHHWPPESGRVRVHVSGGVHPDHRGRGAGHALLGWQLDAARRTAPLGGPDRARLSLVAYAEEHRNDQRALYEDLSLRSTRWYADLSRSLAEPLPVRTEPPGVRIVPFNRKRFEAVRAAHNAAFVDHWGSHPIDQHGWEEQLLRPGSRLCWSWVALAAETSEVVGYATSSTEEDSEPGGGEGWTDRLGVRPAWRRRGVARALLIASLHSFAEAGLESAGVGVDADGPSGFSLYSELGYRRTHTVVMHVREEPLPLPRPI